MSTDPALSRKEADIVGLHLGPPTNALVLSVDEKPTFQRSRGSPSMSRRRGAKTLTGASFKSREQLVRAIEDFLSVCNQKAAPFVWRKREVKGAQLRNTISHLCN